MSELSPQAYLSGEMRILWWNTKVISIKDIAE